MLQCSSIDNNTNDLLTHAMPWNAFHSTFAWDNTEIILQTQQIQRYTSKNRVGVSFPTSILQIPLCIINCTLERYSTLDTPNHVQWDYLVSCHCSSHTGEILQKRGVGVRSRGRGRRKRRRRSAFPNFASSTLDHCLKVLNGNSWELLQMNF